MQYLSQNHVDVSELTGLPLPQVAERVFEFVGLWPAKLWISEEFEGAHYRSVANEYDGYEEEAGGAVRFTPIWSATLVAQLRDK